MVKSHNFKVGDVVKVKPDIKDPDFGIDIGGWHGRISEMNPEQHLVCIDWDSLTLKNIPSFTITQAEEGGMAWHQMYLEMSEIEPATARDRKNDVDKMLDKLEAKHAWDHLGEEGKRIGSVLSGIDSDDEWAAFEAWEAHFRKVLHLPFEAEVVEFQERSPLQAGNVVVVRRIMNVVDLYGIIVEVQHKSGVHHFPLCDLEASNRKSSNHVHVKDYAVWFANH